MAALVSVDAIRSFDLPVFTKPDSQLVVAEAEKQLPISIGRVFAVRAERDTVRGNHAHRRCTQVLVCLHGRVSVRCDDGNSSRIVELERPNAALLIPPSIWAEQTYLDSPTVLLVLCDRPFEEEDYIRSRKEFEAYRATRTSLDDAGAT